MIQYGHVPGGGDAIGSGFLYRGKALPALRGKYVFTDISTGRIWYADYKEMLAADDGDPETMVDAARSQDCGWDKSTVYDTMFPIVGIGVPRARREDRDARRAGPSSPARGAPTRTSRSTPPASSTSSRRPTARSAPSSALGDARTAARRGHGGDGANGITTEKRSNRG